MKKTGVIALFLAVFSVSVAGNRELDIPDRPRFSIDTINNSTTIISSETGILPKRMDNNPLFKDCFYCKQDNRIWYSPFESFEKMIWLCHFDRVLFYVNRQYKSSNVDAQVRYYFSISTKGTTLDSAYVTIRKMEGNKVQNESRVLQFGQGQKVGHGNALSESSDIRIPLAYTAKQLVRSFKSEMVSKASIFPLQYRFSIDGLLYSFDLNGTFNSLSGLEIREFLDTTSAAYRIETSPDLGANADDCDNLHAVLPVIDNIKVDDEFGTMSVTLGANSIYGLDSVLISGSSGLVKKISFNGEKTIDTYLGLPWGSRDSALIIEVVDIYGNRQTQSIVVNIRQRSFTAYKQDEQRMDILLKTWAHKGIGKKILYGASRFSGKRGLIGRLCMKLAKKDSVNQASHNFPVDTSK